VNELLLDGILQIFGGRETTIDSQCIDSEWSNNGVGVADLVASSKTVIKKTQLALTGV
jgi:hypothetical protein